MSAGEVGHPTKECTAPGGGADPKKEELWNAYKKLKIKKKQETKGKGRSERSEPQDQPPTANTIIVAAAVDRDGAFPSGAAGLDSWGKTFIWFMPTQQIVKKSGMRSCVLQTDPRPNA